MHNRNIAIVGYGKIAQDQHAPSIAATDGVTLAAVVSPDGQTADGVPLYDSLSALAASGLAIDAVALCTPPYCRAELAMAAADFGWDVLMEKPPAATVREAQVAAEYIRSKGRVAFATWHSQYNDAVDAAASRLAGQAITSFHIDWREDVRKWHPGQDWIWQPGGFGVFDPGINALSIATKILPCPLLLSSAILQIAENHQTPIAADLNFGGALMGKASARFDFREDNVEVWQMRITTKKESLLLSKGGTELWVDDQQIVAAQPKEYQHIYARFAQLMEARQSDVDLRPLQLVADAFMIGERQNAPAFDT